MLATTGPAPASSGRGVLRIVGTNKIIDATALRKDPDARILTDDPEAICGVLGIPFPDGQVIEAPGETTQ